MPDNLLSLFLAKHLLGRRQESTDGDLAKLLLLQELCNIHSHAEFMMALADLADKTPTTACDKMPDASAQNAIARAKLVLNLEV